MPSLWTVAVVQMDVQLGDVAANLQTITHHLDVAAEDGARLVVFPECAIPGYCYRSKDEAWPYAQTIPGPDTDALTEVCRRLNVFAVVGLLEKDGRDLYNAAVCVGPDGLVGSYRKTHLPYLGVDRFVTPGNRPYEVLDLGGLKIGMLICFDGSFPEPCRVLALKGADLIVLPTNWPDGALCSATHVPAMRAHENHIYFLSCNRVGIENAFRFIGCSRITDWTGADLAALDHPGEGMIMADLDPLAARAKRVILVPGEYEIDRIANRRPELYGPIVEPVQRPEVRRQESA
jgi:predicted amidohydrolase